jgi:hypothetical protein
VDEINQLVGVPAKWRAEQTLRDGNGAKVAKLQAAVLRPKAEIPA